MRRDSMLASAICTGFWHQYGKFIATQPAEYFVLSHGFVHRAGNVDQYLIACGVA